VKRRNFGLVVLALILGIGFWTWMRPLDQKASLEQENFEKRNDKSVSHSLLESERAAPIYTVAIKHPGDIHLLSDDARSVVTQCLGIEGSNTLEDLLTSITSQLGASEKTFRQDLFHIKLKDGTKRRLRIYLDDSGEGALKKRIQFFSEDKEGIGILEEIPREDAENPTDEVVNRYLALGEVVFQEATYGLEFAEELNVEVIEQNGRLIQIHAVGTKYSIGCHLPPEKPQIECKCLTGV
jgi:hypothetical protein